MDCSNSDVILLMNKLEWLLLFENECTVTHVDKKEAVASDEKNGGDPTLPTPHNRFHNFILSKR
jgi:hypothetical protein